jgi:hypothetical protein
MKDHKIFGSRKSFQKNFEFFDSLPEMKFKNCIWEKKLLRNGGGQERV